MALVLVVSGFAWPAAAAPVLSVSPNQALRFGSFVVLGTGSRTVNSSGAVTNAGVLPVGTGTGPALFTLSYDRGAPATGPIVVTVLISLAQPGGVSQNGLSASVSQFDTDLPGIPLLIPAQSVLYTMPVCSTQVCSITFHIGGRIDVTQPGTGGTVTVPLAVTASLVSVL